MKNILSHHKNAISAALKSGISRFTAPAVLFFLLCALGVQGQITGTVFRDFDGDGTRDANEPLIPGITVTAFSAAGTQCGTTTTAGNNAPNYSLTGCGTAAARVEFTIPASGTCATASRDYAALGGSAYGSSVQFVNGNSTNVNFGLHDPEDYNQGPNNTTVYVPYYGHGDPTIVGGASGARDWLVGFPYNNSGGTVPSKRINGNIIGSTWGLAYSKRAKKLFSSAVFHRHIGLGTLGTGGIYITDETAFTTATFYDLDANGYRTRADNSAPAYGLGSSFNFDQASGTKYSVTFQGSPDPLTNQPSGLGVVGSNSDRGLVASPSSPSYDPAAFDQAGKVSLGDLEISENEEYLFVINLYTRKLLRLKLDNVAAPTGITEVMEYSLPNITVNNGLLRPWALKFYRGKLYVGAVSTGENGGQNIVNGATDLRAYVFEVTNPTGTLTFNTTPILDQPLNHVKGSPSSGVATQWYPWTKTSQSGIVVGLNTVYPQPLLSDIEFSDRGDMVLAFTDRAGNQYGGGNYIYLGDNATLSYATTGGDIQIAGLNCTTGAYTRENNGQFVSTNGETYTGSPNNAQGPGNGEFFHTDAFSIHSETAAGAIAVLKGDAKVIITDMDPLNFLSGGSMKLSTTNGFESDRYQLYVDGITGVTNPGLGKANGLGDIELGGVLPPLEIGNRIWRDTDSDGIQDAGENGIANVTLELFADFDNDNNPDGAALATTNTAPNGTWYFNAANVTDGDPDLTGNQAGPQPEKQYLVRVGTADWTAGAAVGDLAGLLLTFANIGGAGQPDVRDNDAALLATIPTLVVNTGVYGASDHSYDIGFRAPCIISAITANPGPCISTTNAHTVTGNITFANPPATGTLTVQIGAFSQTFNAPFTSPQAYSIAGINSNGTSQTVNAVFSADGTCINSTTYMAPAACCPAPALICAGESYTLTAQAGLTDYQWFNDLNPISGANSSTYIATQSGSYTWTAVDNQCPIGGCCPLVLNPCALPCAMTVTSATPTACVLATNTYSLNVVVTYTNQPSGNITVNTSNGGTITVPQTSSPQTITLTGLTANGTANIGVTAFFVATPTCTNTLANAYNAPAACDCIQPAANFVPIPAKCINLVPQDNGRIVLTAFTNADRFGVNAGNTYSGPAYAAATIITGINQDLQTGIPNVGGGIYTVRIFNGSNTCFRDYEITVPPGFPCKSDPMGFIYCEESGKIITGGTITVTPPAGATYVITQNGSTGVYQFFTDAFVPGIYTMTYTPPAGYMASTNRFPGPTLDPTGQPNPYIIGSGSASGTVLDNFTAAANPFYMVFNFESGDPEVFNNNIPLKGCCVAPVLTVQNGAICAGDVINLTTRVTGNTPTGVLTFHATQADALAGTNALLNTFVAPAATTTYYVRSTATGRDGTCSDVEPVQITVVNPPVAFATINGSVCPGSSIDLSTLVANSGGGNLSFYSTQSNAQAGTSPLVSSTVSPASATNYYVRSTFTSSNTTCASAKEVIVTIKPLVCGAITISGPN